MGPKPPLAPSSPGRVARRRQEVRQRLMTVAAQHFALLGPDAVRLEDVAEAADVARGTLYSLFPSKAALVDAIHAELLAAAMSHLNADAGGVGREAVARLLRTYTRLWRDHRDAFRFSHVLMTRSADPPGPPQQAFLQAITRVLRPAEDAAVLRFGTAVQSGLVVSRVGVPLLEALEGQPDAPVRFVEAGLALLLRSR